MTAVHVWLFGAIDHHGGPGNPSVMPIVPLAADERLSTAFARYEAAWTGDEDDLPAARLELCQALLACGEQLPPSVLAQMDRDRAALVPAQVVRV